MTSEDTRERLRGMTCGHKRAFYAPCNECKKFGRKCKQLNCPDCGLFWDERE